MGQKLGRDVLIEQFLCDGIHHMFGNPGTVEQGFLDSLESYPDFHYILSLQETIAVAMADAFARKRKRPAVVQLHSGVGLGNGVGMIYQAMRGHSPLVVITGEAGVRFDAFDAQMAADLVSIARPVTKWATRVLDPASLLRVIRRATKIAMTPPMGPVFVALPMDILDAPALEEVVPTSFLDTRVMPQQSRVSDIAQLLANAKRPLFIIGDGIAQSGAEESLVSVAEAVGAEVWGADSSESNMPASHPLYQGLLGHMFGSHSSPLTSQADVVFICGTYVFPEVFPSFSGVFAPGAKVIHVDLNAYEIAKNFPVDIGVVADPRSTLEALSATLTRSMSADARRAAESRLNECSRAKSAAAASALDQDNHVRTNFPLRVSAAMAEIGRQAPPNVVVFDEALTSSQDLNRYLPADSPGSFFQTRGGSLGVGLPGAIGLKLADPSRTVIGFSGDGGSMYTIQALWTAARHNVAAKFVICNNRGYRLLKLNIQQYWKEREIGGHPFPHSFELDTPQIDFVSLSTSLGVPALRVERHEELAPAVASMLETPGPFLLELVIDGRTPGEVTRCVCGQ